MKQSIICSIKLFLFITLIVNDIHRFKIIFILNISDDTIKLNIYRLKNIYSLSAAIEKLVEFHGHFAAKGSAIVRG